VPARSADDSRRSSLARSTSVFHLDFRLGFPYTYGMETITIPIVLLMSLVTAIATAGGVWFVTQKRLRDLETRADRHDQRFDQKFDQVIAAIGGLRVDMTAEINGLRTEINGLRADMDTKIDGLKTEINAVKVEVAKVQGSNMALNEKFDLFLQGRLIPAATQPPAIVAA